eukprot:362555-Chlamydomonas_euryale.AAC.9
MGSCLAAWLAGWLAGWMDAWLDGAGMREGVQYLVGDQTGACPGAMPYPQDRSLGLQRVPSHLLVFEKVMCKWMDGRTDGRTGKGRKDKRA